MKSIRIICALVLIAFTPAHLFASPTVINSSGQQLLSIFDGLKPNPIAQSALRGLFNHQALTWLALVLVFQGCPRAFSSLAEETVPGGNCALEDLQVNRPLFRENVTNPTMKSVATYLTS